MRGKPFFRKGTTMSKTQAKNSSEELFGAIRKNDFEQVKALITAQPELVNAIAPKRPLDTRGMSPLQVALCTGWHRKIAWLLLENNADENYIPEKKWAEEVRPVLFDAANVAIWNVRRYAWDGKSTEPMKLVWKHTKDESDEAYAFLERVLKRGADVGITDYYGRNVLMEAVPEASNLCPILNRETGEYYPGRPVTPEMCDDLRRIFSLLIDSGADINNASAYSKKSIREHYENEPVWQICGELFAEAK